MNHSYKLRNYNERPYVVLHAVLNQSLILSRANCSDIDNWAIGFTKLHLTDDFYIMDQSSLSYWNNVIRKNKSNAGNHGIRCSILVRDAEWYQVCEKKDCVCKVNCGMVTDWCTEGDTTQSFRRRLLITEASWWNCGRDIGWSGRGSLSQKWLLLSCWMRTETYACDEFSIEW